jgi:hypothetical protein
VTGHTRHTLRGIIVGLTTGWRSAMIHVRRVRTSSLCGLGYVLATSPFWSSSNNWSLISIPWDGCCVQWLPEIRYFLPKETPIALFEVSGEKGEPQVISPEEGGRIAEQLGASFAQCSHCNSWDAFATLARAAIEHKRKRTRRTRELKLGRSSVRFRLPFV